jgi:hypothetical protein
MRRAVQAVVLGTLLVGAASCGASTGRPLASGSAAITAEEIGGTHSDAYALVQALRPQWLRVRGASSVRGGSGQVQVYLDGSHMGGVSFLRQIATQSVGRIEYMDGLEATQRWGLDHGSGAIVVHTRGARR